MASLPLVRLICEFRRTYAIAEANFWALTMAEVAVLDAGLEH